ncbi:uncharacterized protein LOC127707834 isoform X1 [Mytilus californianus]|uniref:uncharacterized protein LOC127707834 isoform X1 n=1 Tax=Mytilus californianus TaxID=6549 RepID=UPI002246AEF3|nr:uncharacterized protein LOC127707834 isoform X1 [Mytilus californianus]
MARKNFVCEWTPKSFILTVVIATVLFNECFIYIIQSFRWPDIGIADYRNYEEEQVILLVSDPQLQGYQMEPPFPIGSFSRWDIDRYLTRTFGLVYHHVKPDIILFLGDLIDEGSTAVDEEYHYAYQRFIDVFSAAEYTKKIYIPGDNDIGGEGRDFRTQKKVDRFVKNFENITGVSTFGFIDYIKLDMQFPEPRFLEKRMLATSFGDKLGPGIHILLTHNTILPRDKPFVISILQQVRPHLIFSGHWHKANVFLCNDCMKDDDSSWSVKQRNIEDMKGWMVTNLTEKPFSITEIMVPTCSYRMGVPNMGYGVAIIRKNGELSYTVLWTPERYKMLYGYLVAICVCLLVCLASRWLRKR